MKLIYIRGTFGHAYEKSWLRSAGASSKFVITYIMFIIFHSLLRKEKEENKYNLAVSK